VTRRFALTGIGKAFRVVRERDGERAKVMVIP
jgi:hypothetical protein